MILTNQGLREAKLVILGSTTVGKSSLVTRLTREMFNPDESSTIGAAFVSKPIPANNPKIKLQIWDTGGSERYRVMAPIYFHDADAAVIVYDITSNNSFQDVEVWLKELKDKGPQHIVIALVGNKSDLAAQRVVTVADARKFIEQNKDIQIFEETSALTGDNVQKLFEQIADKLCETGKPQNTKGGVMLVDPRVKQNKQSGCNC